MSWASNISFRFPRNTGSDWKSCSITSQANFPWPKCKKKKFLEQIQDELKFLDYAPKAFMSAQKNQGVRALFPMIRSAYESASKRVGTGELNRFVETLQWEYHTKIRYLTQAGVRPPTFVAFIDKQSLHFSAERNLINR